MGRRQRWGALYFAALLGLGGCGPDEDVEILDLPPVERPSPEARLGIPEVAGVWTFAGWEIIEGDSMSLERTFPSFGELRFEAQRLDSIAGSFVLGGVPVPVVGDVRRDGRLTFVTLAGGGPQRFVAGTYVQDTLWLELSSVLPVDEWPRDARAAFVRGAPSEPAFAWLRGARVVEAAPPPAVDSLFAGDPAVPDGLTPGPTVPRAPSAGGAPPAGGLPAGQPQPPPAQTRQPTQQPTTRPGQQTPPTAAQPTPSVQQPPAQPPAGQPVRPPVSQPNPQPPAAAPEDRSVVSPPPSQPPAEEPPAPSQQPQPPPPADPPADEDPAPLLGDPINP